MVDALSVLTFAVVLSKTAIEPVSDTKSKVSICPSTCKSLDTEAFITSKKEEFSVDILHVFKFVTQPVSLLFNTPAAEKLSDAPKS